MRSCVKLGHLPSMRHHSRREDTAFGHTLGLNSSHYLLSPEETEKQTCHVFCSLLCPIDWTISNDLKYFFFCFLLKFLLNLSPVHLSALSPFLQMFQTLWCFAFPLDTSHTPAWKPLHSLFLLPVTFNSQITASLDLFMIQALA